MQYIKVDSLVNNVFIFVILFFGVMLVRSVILVYKIVVPVNKPWMVTEI